MTTDMKPHIRASRVRVARSRGALTGLLLIVLGAWAALIPFIGPYFNFAFTPSPNTSWHWTTERGVFEVLPGAAAALGGLLLMVSANRVMASFGGWLAAAGGAWLIVGPSLAHSIGFTHLGSPDPSSRSGVQTLEELLFFFAIGAAILFLAALGLGRLSVHSVRDVRAAEKRAAAEQAAAERAEAERLNAERARGADRAPDDRVADDRAGDRGVGEQPVGERRTGDRRVADRRVTDGTRDDRTAANPITNDRADDHTATNPAAGPDESGAYPRHPGQPTGGAPQAGPGEAAGPPPAGQYGNPPAGQYGNPPAGQYGVPPAGPAGPPPAGPYGAPPDQRTQ